MSTLKQYQQSLSVDNVLAMTIEDLSKKYNIEYSDMCAQFLESDVAQKLSEPDDTLWAFGPASIIEWYEIEQRSKKTLPTHRNKPIHAVCHLVDGFFFLPQNILLQKLAN